MASKQHSTCNWVQAMEGNIDTAHISHLHQWDGIDDIPDDGSDKPGYPSNAMSWKFWRHDRAPRLEVDDTWYGYRYAGIRTTPNGNTHVRVTAYALPYAHHGRVSIPFSVGLRDVRADRRRELLALLLRARGLAEPAQPTAARTCSRSPRSRPRSSTATQRHRPSPVHRGERLPDRPGRAADRAIFSGVDDFVSQDLMVTESMGPIYDRTQEQLGSTDKAISRMRHILLSAAKGLAEGKEPPAVAPAWTSPSIRGAEKILEPGEDWRDLGTEDDPVVREALGRDHRRAADRHG